MNKTIDFNSRKYYSEPLNSEDISIYYNILCNQIETFRSEHVLKDDDTFSTEVQLLNEQIQLLEKYDIGKNVINTILIIKHNHIFLFSNIKNIEIYDFKIDVYYEVLEYLKVIINNTQQNYTLSNNFDFEYYDIEDYGIHNLDLNDLEFSLTISNKTIFEPVNIMETSYDKLKLYYKSGIGNKIIKYNGDIVKVDLPKLSKKLNKLVFNFHHKNLELHLSQIDLRIKIEYNCNKLYVIDNERIFEDEDINDYPKDKIIYYNNKPFLVTRKLIKNEEDLQNNLGNAEVINYKGSPKLYMS